MEYKPENCCNCGATDLDEDPEPFKHQVTHIPPKKKEVTEHQLYRGKCRICGAITCAPWPEGVPKGAFSPEVQAMIAVMSGSYRASKRAIKMYMWDFHSIDICEGMVCKTERAVSEALAEPVEEVREYIREQPSVNVDETGWRQENKKAWLWGATVGLVTTFLIRFSRGSKVVGELLGDEFRGVLGSDRFSAYSAYRKGAGCLWQLCWAHLKRDFVKISERYGASGRIGNALLDCHVQMFKWWHRVRDGTLKRSSFQTYMAELKREVGDLLRQGAACDCGKTARTCQKILKVEKFLWTFVYVEGIEPTNNGAERVLRHGVLWRKGCFGTQSRGGSDFVERILSTVSTLRAQGCSVLDYVTAACEASLHNRPAPTLLPTGN